MANLCHHTMTDGNYSDGSSRNVVVTARSLQRSGGTARAFAGLWGLDRRTGAIPSASAVETPPADSEGPLRAKRLEQRSNSAG
jgi:hypothetical protein